MAILAGRDVTIERVTFDQLAGSPVDIEPDSSLEGATNVTISDNTIGSYGLTRPDTCWLLAAEGAAGSRCAMSHSSGTPSPAPPVPGYDGEALGLTVSSGPTDRAELRHPETTPRA